MRTLGSPFFLAALLASGAAGAAHADVRVHEQVGSEMVGVGDPFQVEVAVEGADGEASVRLPPGDFRVLGQSQSTELELRSGSGGQSQSRTERFIFTVAANRPGTLTIPPARVSADGQELDGQSVQVAVQAGHVARPARVDDEDSNASDPFAAMRNQLRAMGLNGPFARGMLDGDPFAGLDADLQESAPIQVHPGDVRLVALPDRMTARVGQQVTVSYYLLTRVPISGVNGLEVPAVDGAATHDIDLGTRLEPERRGGEVRVLIARKALFPSRPGELVIPPAKANVAVGNGFSDQQVAATSARTEIAVRALPPGPALAAVGRWSLAFVGPQQVRAGEPITLKVTAFGTGDLDALPEPKPSLPADWKVFPPVTHEQPTVDHGVVGGERTWEITAIPEREGDVTLPPVKLETFDPDRGEYVTATSEPLALRVAPAAIAPTQLSARAAPPEIRSDPFGVAFAAAALAGIALVAAGVLRWRKRIPTSTAAQNDREFAAARRLLQQAHERADAAQPEPCLDALERSLDSLAIALRGRSDAAKVREPLRVAADACRRQRFLRSSDPVAARRVLELADRAFECAGP